jgi:hypothetical protein
MRFNFLRPGHLHHAYYNKLCAQYEATLYPTTETKQDLAKDAGSAFVVLKGVKYAAAWSKQQLDDRAAKVEQEKVGISSCSFRVVFTCAMAVR